MESLRNTQEQTYNQELIKFFESHGYEDVQVASSKNFNDILYATKNGEPCFIKKYNSRQKSTELTQAKTDTEIACYQNLPKDLLIDVIEANADEHYLVLKRVEMTDIEIDEQFVIDFTDIAKSKFKNINASFLPETAWGYYEEIFVKLEKIEAAGFINNSTEIIALFKNNKELIQNAKQIFSHHDFGTPNVKKVNGEIKVFDYEFSRRDNAMHDMACIYINIKDSPELKNKFFKQIENDELFNQRLLDLMVIRRAVTVLHAQLSRTNVPESNYFKMCKNALQEKVNELSAASDMEL